MCLAWAQIIHKSRRVAPKGACINTPYLLLQSGYPYGIYRSVTISENIRQLVRIFASGKVCEQQCPARGYRFVAPNNAAASNAPLGATLRV